MPYTKSPRPYKHEYLKELERKELPARLERQRARRKLDAEGVDRKGKDVAHKKALSKGGSNATGIRLESPHQNRSFRRTSSGAMKSATDPHFRKK